MESEIIQIEKRKITVKHLRFCLLIDNVFDSLIALVISKDLQSLTNEQQIIVKNYHCFIRKNTLYKNTIECILEEDAIKEIIKTLSQLDIMLTSADYAYVDQLIENIIPNEQRYITEEIIMKLQRVKEYFKNTLGVKPKLLETQGAFCIVEPMYYDSHTHLNDEQLMPQRPAVVERFMRVGGKGLVTIGTNLVNSKQCGEIAQQAFSQFPNFWLKGTIGLHPSVITHEGMQRADFSQAVQKLKDLYQIYQNEIVAIGEIGTDLHTSGTEYSLHDQQELFGLQCDLATELNLPIVIHSRDDFQGTRDVLQNYTHLKIYFHCRGYQPEQVHFLQDHCPKLWIGLCGNVTYPKAQILRDSLQKIGSDQLLLETDAPYLAPQGLRGTLNESANLVSIYEFVAFELKKPLVILQQEIEQNFKRLYQE